MKQKLVLKSGVATWLHIQEKTFNGDDIGQYILDYLVYKGIVQTLDCCTYTVVGGGGGTGITNLAFTASPNGGIVTSDSGTDATLTLVDATNAGLMSSAMFTQLNSNTAALSNLLTTGLDSTDSIVGNGTSGNPFKLENDIATPSGNMLYGTDSGGNRGWQTMLEMLNQAAAFIPEGDDHASAPVAIGELFVASDANTMGYVHGTLLVKK